MDFKALLYLVMNSGHWAWHRRVEPRSPHTVAPHHYISWGNTLPASPGKAGHRKSWESGPGGGSTEPGKAGWQPFSATLTPTTNSPHEPWQVLCPPGSLLSPSGLKSVSQRQALSDRKQFHTKSRANNHPVGQATLTERLLRCLLSHERSRPIHSIPQKSSRSLKNSCPTSFSKARIWWHSQTLWPH